MAMWWLTDGSCWFTMINDASTKSKTKNIEEPYEWWLIVANDGRWPSIIVHGK